MLKQIGIKSLKNGNNYIAEVEVLDTDANKQYYVVAQLGSLLYATFESSYIDYIKNSDLDEPNKIEGDTYWWWDEKNTQYFEFYNNALGEASALMKRNTIARKYARMKKPSDELKYEVVSMDTMDTFACGPLGTIYEIEVSLLEEHSIVFVNLDTSFDKVYAISKDSLIKTASLGKFKEYKPVEEIVGTENIKKSKYYALYYLVEQFHDGMLK